MKKIKLNDNKEILIIDKIKMKQVRELNPILSKVDEMDEIKVMYDVWSILIIEINNIQVKNKEEIFNFIDDLEIDEYEKIVEIILEIISNMNKIKKK